MLDGSKCHNPTEASTSEAEIVLAQRKKEASVAASLFLVFVLYSVYFSDTVAVVWVGVPFTVSTIGTAVPAVRPAGICRLNCCRPSVDPGEFPA